MAHQPGRLPNFLVIGAPRAGTTWLWTALRDEPAVFVPDEKELNYFNREAIDFPEEPNPRSRWSVDRYCSLFSRAEPGQVCGELSPAYLASPTAPPRIAQVIPGVRLIVIVRDPVGRAVSDYRYRQRRGTVRPMGLMEAIQVDPSIIDRGRYSVNLQRYLEHFSPERLLLVDFADIKTRPYAVMTAVGSFIGVDLVTEPPEAVNEAGRPRFSPLNRVLSSAERSMRRPPLDRAWRLLRSTPLRRAVRAIRAPRSDGVPPAPVDPAAVRLLADIYAGEEEWLRRRLGFNPQNWTRIDPPSGDDRSDP